MLNGWKEISGYMRQGVRTVQRWESLGLPVHRPRGARRNAVIAFPEELDAWARATPMSFAAQLAALKADNDSLKVEVEFLRQQLSAQRSRRAQQESPPIGPAGQRQLSSSEGTS